MLSDFLNSSGNSNHKVSNPFRHFGRFSSLTPLMGEFGWFYDIFLSPYTPSKDDIIFLPIFCSLGERWRQKHAPPS
jgi:hypothetical protein